jgi:hypothetical protein
MSNIRTANRRHQRAIVNANGRRKAAAEKAPAEKTKPKKAKA